MSNKMKSPLPVPAEIPISKLSPSIEEARLSGSVRSGRSRASSVHSNNSSHGYSRSPIRPPHNTNAQKLRNPSNNFSQRRSSMNGLRDVTDFSSSIGMPYSYSVGNSTHLNAQYCLNSGASTGSRTGIDGRGGSISSRSSPRSSFSNYDAVYADINGRRYSEHSHRKPSAEEVFDLMEREQDAIVLKLMREIAQLKEDNRALLSTVNHLTSGGHQHRSHSQTRSLDSKRDSSAIMDEAEIQSRMFAQKKSTQL